MIDERFKIIIPGLLKKNTVLEAELTSCKMNETEVEKQKVADQKRMKELEEMIKDLGAKRMELEEMNREVEKKNKDLEKRIKDMQKRVKEYKKMKEYKRMMKVVLVVLMLGFMLVLIASNVYVC